MLIVIILKAGTIFYVNDIDTESCCNCSYSPNMGRQYQIQCSYPYENNSDPIWRLPRYVGVLTKCHSSADTSQILIV
jgi:hypothetical protein